MITAPRQTNLTMRKLTLLTAVLAAAGLSSTPNQMILKVAVADLSLGVNRGLNASGDVAPVVYGDWLAFCFGVRFTRHWGAGLGAVVVSGEFMNSTSYFPVAGYAFYDLNPDARWCRGMGYGSVRFVHSETSGWSGNTRPPHFIVAAGIGYTFFVVSPHLEAGYDTGHRAFTCSLGMGIPGGTYVFR